MQEVKLPELGENIETVEVSAVLVAVGDRISAQQPVVEVETEKASLEVPSTVSGRVEEILVEVGGQVRVGETLLRVSVAEGVEQAASPEPPKEPAASPLPSPPTPVVATAAEPEAVIAFPTARPTAPGASVPAAPSTRALARQLGADISRVPGSGPGGRISREDVKAYVKSIVQGVASAPGGAAPAAAELPDFSQWGEVERERLSRIRRVTASAMATAWSQVPHVTQFDRADITQLESMRKRFNQRPEAAGRKLTMTAIVVKMVAAALKQFPKFNASLDLQAGEVILKKYIHVGVAVDTDRGLLVPVIRDVDRKSLVEVALELSRLAERARNKKVGPDEMKGSTFTVSNLGGLGTTYFSPIVYWPEVAILGVGRAEQQAVHVDGRFEPRLIMPLSVSYDHRWIDGADAARFLRFVAEALEQPLLLLLDE